MGPCTVGCVSGDRVTDYTDFNTPSDPARHARLASISESADGVTATTTFLDDDCGFSSRR